MLLEQVVGRHARGEELQNMSDGDARSLDRGLAERHGGIDRDALEEPLSRHGSLVRPACRMAQMGARSRCAIHLAS